MPSQNSVTRSCKWLCAFARWQNVSTLRSASSSAQVSQESHVHGPVVRQVVWSPWPVVQWSPQCCGSCRSVALHELHSRAGFGLHSTWDRTRGLMFCLVEEIERQDPSQDGISVFSLNFRVLSRGKGGLVEESESQDPSRDGISVFSLNSRVLSWGKERQGRRSKPPTWVGNLHIRASIPTPPPHCWELLSPEMVRGVGGLG